MMRERTAASARRSCTVGGLAGRFGEFSDGSVRHVGYIEGNREVFGYMHEVK
jgi:hypothetical protein